MNDKDEKYNNISNQTDLDYLVDRISKGTLFANKFKFQNRNHFLSLFEKLNIAYEEFTKNYFYFDKTRNLHIAESHFDYVWISTYGLIPNDKSTNNKEVNACINQYITFSLLLDKAIEICSKNDIYDIDSYNYELLNELSPALFHNLLFYIEVFCKAYLSLNSMKTPHIHKISDIYLKLIEVMYEKKHNDSLLQVSIIDSFAKYVEHVNMIPGDFKEHFVKYDDNKEDNTVILFQPESLYITKNNIDLSREFIIDNYYQGSKSHYLKQGFYQKLLDEVHTDKEKELVEDTYGHLVSIEKLKSKIKNAL